MARRDAPPPELGEREYRSSDGKVMPYTKWLPKRGRGVGSVLVAVHGLSGAASDFWLLGERLPQRGIAVYAPELRGQGNDPDPARRGDIRSRHQWVDDLEVFSDLVAERHPGRPVFWFGESLGSLVALEAADRVDRDGDRAGAGGPDGLILASPVPGFRDGLPRGRAVLARAASVVVPEKRVRLTDLSGAHEVQVTSDTTHDGRMAVTPHAVDSFTLRTLAEVGKLVRRCTWSAGEIPAGLPVLVLYTPHDPLASREQIEEFFNQIASDDKTKVFFPESYHLVLHDTERYRAVEVLQRWIAEKGG
jgi:alpha-beta hydrolase superfamily lysophospholipase